MSAAVGCVRVADWKALSLSPGGRSVIEASAGTGKTWTIAALYLRLLLEEGFTPRQIVVATFTDAAASELRERLRSRLLSAEATAFDAAATVPTDDAVAIWLESRWRADPGVRRQDLDRLRLAQAELDVAPIGTLHGLCARILREQPFAAGSSFEYGRLVDGGALAAELGTDLRRLLGQGEPAAADDGFPPESRAWLAAENVDAHALASMLKPGTDIRPGDAPALPPDAADILREGAREGMFRAGSVLPRAWNAVADALASGDLALVTREQLKLLGLPNGVSGVLKASENDPAILRAAALSSRLVEPLQACIDQRRLSVWKRLRDWAIAHKQAWMRRHSQRSFDDLLLDVHAALDAERAGASRPLADALYAAWPVALVDEFQDTDGLQYDILDAVYRDADDAPRGRLVMIGDPKQAIYRFRGGDIHTYRRAAASAGEALGLRVNQRSSSGYVDAVNRFFSLAGPGLDAGEGVSSGIVYLEVEAAGRRDGTPYAIDGQPITQALHIHFNDIEETRQPRRVALALQACANDIAGMLADGGHRIGQDPLSPGDIAVLLPKGRDVLQLRRLLEARGVPCVTQARDSVFRTDTARDLQVVLHGVLHAESLPSVRAALATPLLGWSLAQLARLDEDPVATQAQVARFHAWRDAWRRRGVLACVESFAAEEGPRWLAGESGERMLTDLRHLGEALQLQADAGGGPAELLDWLAGQRMGLDDDGDEAREARQLRIESEAPRVRLMTLHASKGLEFPVVFLPMMWAHGEQDEKGPTALTDPADGRRWLRLDAAARDAARREQQDERFRVLYVALTRAVHACHVYALPPGRAADGRNDRPAAGTARSALDVLLARMPHPPMSPELVDAGPEIAWHPGWTSRDFVRHVADAGGGEGPRQARAMPPDPAYPLPSRHSFSTLTRGLQAADAAQANAAEDETTSPFDSAADPETVDAQGEGGHAELLALSQVRGTGIGNALHAVLERRAVGRPLAAQPALLREALVQEGLWKDEREGGRLAAAVARRLDAVLSTPLADDMPAIGVLAQGQLRAEMEFSFALGETSLRRLREAFIAHGAGHLLPEGERSLRGLMTGKIDLLFEHGGRIHVLDWKGNFLGLHVEDYAASGMAHAMAHHGYELQALLYTVALERHLRLRVPGYRRALHLGDAWYVFVRGAGLAQGAGVWHRRFDDGLLDAVDAALPGIAVEAQA